MFALHKLAFYRCSYCYYNYCHNWITTIPTADGINCQTSKMESGQLCQCERLSWLNTADSFCYSHSYNLEYDIRPSPETTTFKHIHSDKVAILAVLLWYPQYYHTNGYNFLWFYHGTGFKICRRGWKSGVWGWDGDGKKLLGMGREWSWFSPPCSLYTKIKKPKWLTAGSEGDEKVCEIRWVTASSWLVMYCMTIWRVRGNDSNTPSTNDSCSATVLVCDADSTSGPWFCCRCLLTSGQNISTTYNILYTEQYIIHSLRLDSLYCHGTTASWLGTEAL